MCFVDCKADNLFCKHETIEFSASSVSLYPYKRSQTFQYVKYTK